MNRRLHEAYRHLMKEPCHIEWTYLDGGSSFTRIAPNRADLPSISNGLRNAPMPLSRAVVVILATSIVPLCLWSYVLVYSRPEQGDSELNVLRRRSRIVAVRSKYQTTKQQKESFECRGLGSVKENELKCENEIGS
jgi:hypothetical protein